MTGYRRFDSGGHRGEGLDGAAPATPATATRNPTESAGSAVADRLRQRRDNPAVQSAAGADIPNCRSSVAA
jgi:hypothetical protein